MGPARAENAEDARRRREDTLHVGATRPAMLLGLPIVWALPLLGGAYIIQTNVTGLEGVAWALAWLVPGYVFARLAVRKSFFGLNVVLVWVRGSLAAWVSPWSDRWTWGGFSRSPLPFRFHSRTKGMRRVA